MHPHEYGVLETLQRLVNHYGRAAVRKDAAPAVFESAVAIMPGFWETHKDILGYLEDKFPFGEMPPRHGKSTWPTLAVDPAPTKTHTAVLCLDGSPYTVAFAGGVTASDLAALVRAAGLGLGLGAEAVGDTLRLSPVDPDGTVTHVRYVVEAPPPSTSGLALVTKAQWDALWDHTDAIRPAAYAPPAPTPRPGTHA